MSDEIRAFLDKCPSYLRDTEGWAELADTYAAPATPDRIRETLGAIYARENGSFGEEDYLPEARELVSRLRLKAPAEKVAEILYRRAADLGPEVADIVALEARQTVWDGWYYCSPNYKAHPKGLRAYKTIGGWYTTCALGPECDTMEEAQIAAQEEYNARA